MRQLWSPLRIKSWFNRSQYTELALLGIGALFIGLSSAIGIWLFKWLIDFFTHLWFDQLGLWLEQWGHWTIALLPVLGGVLVGALLHFFIGEERHHGVAGIIEAVALAGGRLRYLRVPVKALGSALSIGSGASVGPEDPSVQIGANLGSLFGQKLRLSDQQMRATVAAGAASGIAAAFNAPIAGVFFAFEVILGEMSGTALSLVVLSSVVSSVFTQAVSGPQPAFFVPAYAFNSPLELPLYLVLGLLAGPIAAFYVWLLYKFKDLSEHFKIARWAGPILAGLVVGLVGIFLPQVFGVGYETIESILRGEDLALGLLVAIMLAKLILTPLSIAGGFLGGVFAPALVIGATLGGAFGTLSAMLFPGAWISGVQSEIDELDGDLDYDVIGLAGALFGLAFVNQDFDPTAGEHVAASNLDDLAAILAGYQINNGGFSWNSNYLNPGEGNETIQETAYAILALNEVERALYLPNLRGAADYMMGVQLPSGGWEDYTGSGENNEVTAEAMWGISAAYPELWVCVSGDCGHPGASSNTIQGAVDAIASGGNIYVGAGSYAESVLVDTSLNLLCAQAGIPVATRTAGSASETIIDVRGKTEGVIVKSDDVLLDGCDILGDSSTYAGVLLYASTGAGNLSNMDVKNNFIHGMALPNPSSTAYVTSYGVFGLGDAVGGVRNTLTELAIQGNKIYDLGGVVSGSDTSAGAGVWLYSLAGGGGGGGALISGNVFENIQTGYDASDSQYEYGTGVAIIDDGDPVLDSGGLVQGNTYTNTFAGAVLYAGTTTFDEANASFSGATLYALNVGNLATVNETTLARYAKTNLPTGYPGSTAYFGRIKDAIDSSDSGATVTASAGTFVEGPQVVIAKDITLTGADKATTIITPAADTGGSGDARGWFLVNSGYTFNLSKVTLDGSGKNIYQAVRSYGEGTIDDCNFKNIRYAQYLGMGIALFGNMTVSNNTFTNMERIGVIAFGTDSTSSLITGNAFTGKGAGDWLDYAVELGGGAIATISNNTISNNLGVASSDGSSSAGILVTTFYGSGTSATITGNTLIDNSDAIAVGYDGSDTSSVSAYNNCISGSTYGVYSTAPDVDAANNWWDSAMGPYNALNNPSGTGDAVTDNVTFTPWLDACGGSPVGGHFRNTTTLEEFVFLQQAVDDPDTLYGHTIVPITAGPFAGTTTVAKDGVVIDLSGRTFTGGSPAFEITADDVTVQNGLLDGWTGSANNASPAVRVAAGADNFSLLNNEVKRWEDGLELLGNVTSFKFVSNWLHDNSDAGLQVNSGALINGVLTIEGNLFKENLGPGIRNDSAATLKAEYNSWGKYNGPIAGVDYNANVDAVPWTFVEPYMDVDPDSNAQLRSVTEGQTFDVRLKVDAQRLYGLTFKLTYDPSRLTLVGSPAFAAPWSGKCADLGSASGLLTYRCSLEYPTPEFTASGGTIMTLTFTTNVGSLPGNGPWITTFDISSDPVDTSAGAVGGAKVWVNNAGYGAPSAAGRDITDGDDGQITINGAANYTGFVDLQGRSNDSGALVQVLDQSDKTASIELANATSAPGGGYTTAYLPSKFLTVGQTYYLFIDRELYLPTTIMMTDPNLIPPPPVPTDWAHFKLLSQRPLTPLSTVILLGGDAVSDDLIDILDAGCIGSAYNASTPNATTCSGQGSSDVNADTYTNLYDLTLMGGNFTLNSSPWTP